MTHNPSRRRFLMQLGAATGAGLTTPLWIEVIQRGGLPFAWGAGESDVLPAGAPIVVHISMDGGNDYLNTLAPVEDGYYLDSTTGRGSLALGPADTLALTGSTYRLHNALPWLASRWNGTGDVGFVLGVGNGKSNFSHFDSIKYWETARLDVIGNSGWLGRYADAVRPDNPLASVAFNDLRLEAIGTSASTLVLQEASSFSYQTGHLSSAAFATAAQKMATAGGTTMTADVARMMGTTFQVTSRIKGADDAAVTGGTSGYGALGPLAKSMVQAALLIKAGVPAQSYAIGQSGYDSHTNQKSMQLARFRELDEALTKFFAVMNGHSRQNDVFVLMTSEFGRQVGPNRDAGTDHGQAGMAILVGGGVKRGVYGQAPTLAPNSGGTFANRVGDAPRPTVDFRTVHATVLNRLAKGDSNVGDDVLGAHYEDLQLFGPLLPPPTTTTTTTAAPTTTTTAANKPPTAAYTINKTSGLVGMVVTVDAAASKDTDGSIVSYAWSWGDGTANGTGVKLTHKYTKRGTFTLRLTVTDNRGATHSISKTVRVF